MKFFLKYNLEGILKIELNACFFRLEKNKIVDKKLRQKEKMRYKKIYGYTN